MAEDKQYTLEELKAKLTERVISDQFKEDLINADSETADYVDDRFGFVFQSFINAIEKAYNGSE